MPGQREGVRVSEIFTTSNLVEWLLHHARSGDVRQATESYCPDESEE